MSATPGQSARWVLGLTGGIASGKSTVAACFAELGADVIDLDQVAREVVAPGTALLEVVLHCFGPGLRLPEGSLDRRALRARVFADPARRRELEALLHPAIAQRTAEHLAASRAPYQIVVNPLLVETGARDRYQRVLVVDVPEALQRQRLAARDGSNPAEIEALLAAQTTREARLAIADDIVRNDGERAALRGQVVALHKRYLGLSGHSSTRAR